MKFVLSSLLLASLCALSSRSVSSTPVVTQSPEVSVMEGETVTITCCWTLEYYKIRLDWLKNLTNIEFFVFYKHSQGNSLQIETSDCSNLTFTNVTIEDSGRYICRVTKEIPYFTKVEGNGTVITVTARNNTMDNTTGGGSHSAEVLIFVLRCLPIVALFTTFIFINYLTYKTQQHTPAAPGNKLTSAQRMEENQEEDEGDEREIE